MRDNIGTIIGLVFGSIFFVALANEFVIFYSEIKYEEVTWSYFLIISTLFGISMLFVGLYIIMALLSRVIVHPENVIIHPEKVIVHPEKVIVRPITFNKIK